MKSFWYLAMTLLGAGAAAGDAVAQALPQGRLVRHLMVDGVRREVILHVPASVDGTRTVPAVLMLHGTSGSGGKFYNISGWTEKADAEGFVAVFPSALSYCLGDDEDYDGVIEPDEFKVTTKWAAGALGTPAMPLCTDAQIAALPAPRQAEIDSRVLRDDVAFMDTLVAALQEELPVDPRRIYVSGFSNGGSMSGRLLIDRSDRFAAFAIAAGLPAVPGPAVRPAPVVFTVGSLDDRFLTPLGLESLPLDETFLQIPQVGAAMGRIAREVHLDSGEVTFAPIVLQGQEVPTFTWRRSLVGADNHFTAAVVPGAAHQYPNGTNHPLVMADLLWAFFRHHSLP
jgi:polyhydroxybutyrate depolymerase